jgi:glycosyltransferase involved in cell wall biosynthesis
VTPIRPSLVMIGELPEPFGGVALLCDNVCRELSRRGVDVHLLDSAPGPVKHLPPLARYSRVTGRYVRGGISALRSPRVVRSWFALVFPVAHQIGPRASLQALVLGHRTYATARRAGTRSIVAHHAGTRGLSALVAARALDAEVTLFVYGTEWTHPTWNRKLSDFVAGRAHRVIACSSYTSRLCMNATGRTDIAVLSPGVDHDRFHPSNRDPECRDDPIVLFVGAMHPRKGADVLARAIPLLSDVPARFIFAGPSGGPLEPEVRSIISGSGVQDRVEFRGQLSSEELPRVLAEADIFVFPTVWGTEGFGMVAAEAMACGVPIVASRIAAIPEVVLDEETGLLVEPGDPVDLASKLRLLLGDPARRRCLGRAGAKHVQQYRWDRLADGLIEVLNGESAPLTAQNGLAT